MNTSYNMRSTQISCVMRAQGTPITSSNVGTVYSGQYFTIAQMGGVANFIAVFDEYRIDAIEVWIEPTFNTAPSTAAEQGTFVSAIDLDDASTPSSYTTVASYQDAVDTSVFSAHYHKWVPTASSAYFAGAVFTGYGSETRPWLDSTSTSIQHYGLKVAVSATTTNSLVFRVMVRLSVTFRGLRST
jgi:hypothetical protein